MEGDTEVLEERDEQRDGGRLSRLAETVSAFGAVLVVLVGLGAVFVLTLVALGTLPEDQKSTVVTASFSVLGTIVGAYFGVRVGAAGKEKAEAAKEATSIRLEEMAAIAPKAEAQEALGRADKRIEKAMAERRQQSPGVF